MQNIEPSSTLGHYITKLHNWGYNGIAMHINPEKNAEAANNFARYLKSNGIGIIMKRNWSELENAAGRNPNEDPTTRTSEELCPYSEATYAYWEKRINNDYLVHSIFVHLSVTCCNCS